MHTVKTYWNGKRFFKLFIFALLMGNITLYCVGMLARRQVVQGAMGRHSKTYTAYLQAVERARKESPQSQSSTTTDANQVSPYWTALKEIRKEFPYSKMNIVLQGTVESERDRKILEMFKTRPRGWTLTDENDGWARSFYVLPTRNIAAFQVVSYVKDDLNAWENTAIIIGCYSFLMLFAFGWFWTRALDERSGDGAQSMSAEAKEQFQNKIRAINQVVLEVGSVLESIQGNLVQNTPHKDVLRALEEMAAQMRLLAVNGSIEAARSSETYRVFHVIMQEINQLATQSKDLLRVVADQNSSSNMADVQRKIAQIQNMLSARANSTNANADAPHGPKFNVDPSSDSSKQRVS